MSSELRRGLELLDLADIDHKKGEFAACFKGLHSTDRSSRLIAGLKFRPVLRAISPANQVEFREGRLGSKRPHLLREGKTPARSRLVGYMTSVLLSSDGRFRAYKRLWASYTQETGVSPIADAQSWRNSLQAKEGDHLMI